MRQLSQKFNYYIGDVLHISHAKIEARNLFQPTTFIIYSSMVYVLLCLSTCLQKNHIDIAILFRTAVIQVQIQLN